MIFYSYDYLNSQITTANWIYSALFLFLTLGLLLVAIAYFTSNKDSKYRELLLLSVISLLLAIGVKLSDEQVRLNRGNDFRQAINVIDFVSNELEVSKEKVYINTTASLDGAIIKVGSNFYRVITANENMPYLLEQMTLHNPKIRLVEVNK